MKVFLMVIQNYQLSVIHRHIQPITQDNIVPSIKEKKLLRIILILLSWD